MSTVLVVSNPAPRGPAGKTILSGTGAPTPAIGTNGDFYFDTAASQFYGPKTDGAWPPPIDLAGVTYATQAEVDAGIENAKAVSPETYQQGITNRIATQDEAEEGTDPLKLMTPERVKQAILANPGGVTYASQAETDAGTETNKAINPVTYQQGITNRLASQAEAEAGTDNTKLMTPLRVAEAISALANNLAKATTPQAEAGVDDTAYMTPLKVAQAIAALGQQLVIATQSEAEAGTDNIKYMTPLRVAQAIAALSNVPDFATQAEVDAGVETTKTISPATLQQGVTNRLASQTEAEAGTDATKLMSPLRVAQAIAALGQQLVMATQAEAEAGTDNSKYMTPLRVAQAIAALASNVSFATQAEVDAGTEPAKAVSPLTYQQGITDRLATQAEAEVGTDATKLMTPQRVAQAIAALSQQLVLATQAEAEAGTDNTKYMTPLRVAQAIAALANTVSFATQAEVDAGIETAKAISPATMQQGITNRIATQAEAEAGTDSTKLMTPERVKQAIDANGGEVNTGANVGTGAGIFRDKTGVQLNFKSLTAGTGVTLTPSADEIEIAATVAAPAFPWPVKIVASDTTLTLADQGIIVQVGGIITLPASAPDGTVFRIYGIPGLVRINSNGSYITGIGTGTDLRPGESALQLVAINLPGLIWAVENRLYLAPWDAARVYRKGEIVSDGSSNYYLSRNEENTQPLTNTTAWLPISPRRVTGAITFSDLAFTATVAPTGLVSGTYTISECGNSLMLTCELVFSGASTNVTAVRITNAKTQEIHTAFFTAFGSGDFEQDIFGYGHVQDDAAFSNPQRADVLYSPTSLQYIEARFVATDNVYKVQMRVLSNKL